MILYGVLFYTIYRAVKAYRSHRARIRAQYALQAALVAAKPAGWPL